MRNRHGRFDEIVSANWGRWARARSRSWTFLVIHENGLGIIIVLACCVGALIYLWASP